MKEYRKLNGKSLGLLILIAYAFSFVGRMIWIYWAKDHPEFFYNGSLMINTNDGYFFASGAQRVLEGLHADNPRIPSMWSYGTVLFTVLLSKFTPMSLETTILYMPAIVSSLVVVPIILIARLFGLTVWGFFSALLGSIAWSYYNRTMIGYYDTDMFSAMAPMFILYFLMKSTIDFHLRSALYAALAITIYPFLYNAGATIVFTTGLLYSAYMLWYHRHEATAYRSVILVAFALVPFAVPDPYGYLMKAAMLIGLYYWLQRQELSEKISLGLIALLFLLSMYWGNVFGLILSKISYYTTTGTSDAGLHFYSVSQTIREAGKIPFETFANRISGSKVGVAVALAGYIVLVIRHRVFILALPLVAIGIFAFWGGLRFTVYAVPIAAMSALYLFHSILEFAVSRKWLYGMVMTLLTSAMLYPNIKHIVDYKVPTVLNKSEVEDLEKLSQIASSKDYTIAWWDYGYPIWFYGHTNTIIDGGKHQNDNYIVSKIMQTTSPELAAGLSRLAVETYVSNGYKIITDTLFQKGSEAYDEPNMLLSELESGSYKLPKKTREVYLYMPYRMMNIFPTVAVFGNLDLKTGKKERSLFFYPTELAQREGGTLIFRNGIAFDAQRGTLQLGKDRVRVRQFIVASVTMGGETVLRSQNYYASAGYAVVYLKSYGRFVVMDTRTLHSMFVQMFMLGRYDKRYFEPVVSSAYTKIYRVKR